MYHCQVHFYFVGRSCKAFEIIREIAPLEHFTHVFSQSSHVEEAPAARADIILASLEDEDAKETVKVLAAAKREDAELILLAGRGTLRFFSWGFRRPGTGKGGRGSRQIQRIADGCEGYLDAAHVRWRDTFPVCQVAGEL